MDYGSCRSCRAQIAWARSAKTGKPMPLDPEPDEERGNVLVDGQSRAHVFKDAAAAAAYQEATPDSELASSGKYLSHFVTCPRAGHHRKAAQAVLT